jgi:hypothetical protein
MGRQFTGEILRDQSIESLVTGWRVLAADNLSCGSVVKFFGGALLGNASTLLPITDVENTSPRVSPKSSLIFYPNASSMQYLLIRKDYLSSFTKISTLLVEAWCFGGDDLKYHGTCNCGLGRSTLALRPYNQVRTENIFPAPPWRTSLCANHLIIDPKTLLYGINLRTKHPPLHLIVYNR